MSAIKTTTGLVSGLDIGGLVDALINVQRAPARRLENRLTNVQTVQAGLGQLQAQLLSLTSSVQKLTDRNTFTSLQVANSDPTQLSVTTRLNSITGSYQFQAVRLATAHRAVSKGFANADIQQIGSAGQLVFGHGGRLDRSVKLDLLNNGQGVRRGVIRITNRGGESTDVDLTRSIDVSDVVNAINSQATGIRAEARGDHIVLTDLTGQSSSNLSVIDLAGGHAAEDLGLAQSVAGTSLTGDAVFQVTDQFTLDLLNDGNGLRALSGADGLSFILADGTEFDVDLDGTANLADVIQKIHSHADNGGKLTAALSNGRLVLTDATTGAGTLQVDNFNGSNAAEVLGLDGVSAGGVLTGRLLIGGLNSVLLHNLRGGQGIAELGEISLTDRTGATATVDLLSAETLDDVLSAINASGLQLRAELDANGTGIVVLDTSGSTSSNLIIADVGAGTVAADLGITTDSAVNSVASGHLGLRRINEASSLSTYSPRGTAVAVGSFRIQDSAGNQAVINISSTAKTIGDFLDRINTASDIDVTARLNDTGDGIVLIDDAGGTGTLQVTEVGGRTAADLHLLGSGVVGSDGKQRIVSRDALIIDVVATDTLNTLATKVNSIGGTVRAAVVSTGAAVNGVRLSLYSTLIGQAGRFTVDDQGVGLGVTDQEIGRDAVLRIGADPASAFLKTSSSNTFTSAVAGLDVTLLQASETPATVTTSPDTARIQTVLQEFVTAYNAYVDMSAELTKYDAATQTRSALQGTGVPLTIQSRFHTLINRRQGPIGNTVRALADVGLRFGSNGKLALNTTDLNDALQDHPDEVRTLFADVSTGFGSQFKKALDSFTDSTTGTLTVQSNSLQSTADSLADRIEQLDALLEVRRAILERRFVQMETVLSGLQSQQTSLGTLTNIIANMRASSSSA
jgi:flagellar hook-associated protein 2